MTLHVLATSPDPLMRFERTRQAMLSAYADWIATRPELRSNDDAFREIWNHACHLVQWQP